MNANLVDEIAAAILYEGYLLYPYRASALKNRQRWNFGVIYPRAYAEQQTAGSADAWSMQSECLLRAGPEAILRARVRFLELTGDSPSDIAQQRASEREITLPDLALADLQCAPFRQDTAFGNGEGDRGLAAAVEFEAIRVADGAFKIRVSIFNGTEFQGADRSEALLHSLLSAHTILSVEPGDFISLMDPPEDLRACAEACRQSGAWPVLVGEDGDKDAVLCSPIILYDYPKIAAESPGALFDGTEIDEILTLRILTLTDDEKLAMSQGDERTREILRRSESMPPEQFMKMHGALRGLKPVDRERA